ncbi:MAG: glycoside hydrolase family 2, partial [Bacteroidales bacterium]|nr:glycoside hydrolase family 2 [Bacteroidales bacterium]
MNIRSTVLAICLLCGTCILTRAQEPHRQKHSINFGLKSPQPEETLPKGKGKVSIPQRKEKTAAVTSYLSAGKDSWALREGWEMCEGGLSLEDWYNATVPGTVLTTLVQQGVYPDPRYGLNNLSIPDDLCRKDWWYRCSFSVPEQAQDKEVFELIFNGINYKADIWLNGQKIGRMEGAFIRGRFDITSLLQPVNELYVHILPPSNPGIPHEQSPSAGGGWNGGALCLDGPTFI